MWIRWNNQRLEMAAPCGCRQAFRLTPAWEIERGSLAGRCGKESCEYNYLDLLRVARRVAACLRKAQVYKPDLAAVSASSYDLVGG